MPHLFELLIPIQCITSYKSNIFFFSEPQSGDLPSLSNIHLGAIWHLNCTSAPEALDTHLRINPSYRGYQVIKCPCTGLFFSFLDYSLLLGSLVLSSFKCLEWKIDDKIKIIWGIIHFKNTHGCTVLRLWEILFLTNIFSKEKFS